MDPYRFSSYFSISGYHTLTYAFRACPPPCLRLDVPAMRKSKQEILHELLLATQKEDRSDRVLEFCSLNLIYRDYHTDEVVDLVHKKLKTADGESVDRDFIWQLLCTHSQIWERNKD